MAAYCFSPQHCFSFFTPTYHGHLFAMPRGNPSNPNPPVRCSSRHTSYPPIANMGSPSNSIPALQKEEDEQKPTIADLFLRHTTCSVSRQLAAPRSSQHSASTLTTPSASALPPVKAKKYVKPKNHAASSSATPLKVRVFFVRSVITSDPAFVKISPPSWLAITKPTNELATFFQMPSEPDTTLPSLTYNILFNCQQSLLIQLPADLHEQITFALDTYDQATDTVSWIFILRGTFFYWSSFSFVFVGLLFFVHTCSVKLPVISSLFCFVKPKSSYFVNASQIQRVSIRES